MRKKDLSSSGLRLNSLLGRAIRDYNLIEDGNRIAVAVSGGKDSFTLLHLLAIRRRWIPVRYHLEALHVVMQGRGLPSLQRRCLKDHVESLGVPFRPVESDLSGGERGRKPGDLSCFWCSWKRRKALFSQAHELGFNKVALGHHKDDIVETFLMNLLFNGSLSTMPPRLELFGGVLTLIRPLAYAGEHQIRGFAREARFPEASCECPVAENTRRRTMKCFLKEINAMAPGATERIFQGLQTRKTEYLCLPVQEPLPEPVPQTVTSS